MNFLSFIKKNHPGSLLINKLNRKNLINKTPTLITGNCIGGFLYHWLGLKFNSPTINLFITNSDFIKMLENFDEFIKVPLKPFYNHDKKYPVAQGYLGIKIFFQHYKNFDSAIKMWNKRIKRIDKQNMGIILPYITKEDTDLIERFNNLPYKNKLAFTPDHIDKENFIMIKNLNDGVYGKRKALFDLKNILGKRYIDSFNYVDWINNLK